MVDQLDDINANCPTDFNHKFIFLSDEFYILSKKKLPDSNDYGGLDLIENGVGQVSSFLENFNKEKKKIPKFFNSKRSFSIVTGTLAYDTINQNVIDYLNKIENLNVKLFKINNNFYGDSVTVAGLLTAKDIISQLRDENLGEAVDQCAQFFGASGYMEESKISKNFRDARIQRIYGGTTEIIKSLIFKEFLSHF